MNKTLLALAAIWMLLPPHAFAGEVRVHALMIRGPVPAAEKLGESILANRLPGVRTFSAPLDEADSFEVDETDRSLPSPDPSASRQRLPGTRIVGTITKDQGLESVRMQFTECAHACYLYSSSSGRLYPSLTESSTGVLAKLGTEGWALSDPDPEGGGPRQVLVIQVVR